MVKRSAFISAVLAIGGSASFTRAVQPGYDPKFVGTPYVVTVIVAGPGPHEFIFSASAIDPDPGDIVTITGSGFTGYTRFTATPGNPATFTLRGVGMTIDDYGTHVIGLSALDNSDQHRASGAIVTINAIIPEPSTVVFSLIAFPFAAKRRRV